MKKKTKVVHRKLGKEKDSFGLVYKLTIGNYFIIGSSTNLAVRMKFYKNKLKGNRYKNKFLQNAYNKYKTLKFEILQDNIPEDILECVEDIWIGANCARVEDRKGGMNMRDAQRPRFDKDTLHKISKSVRKTDENIYQYSLNGDFIREYYSYAEAGKFTGISSCEISNCCKGKALSAGGFQWSNLKVDNFHPYTFKKAESLRKIVYQYDLNGQFIQEWCSVSEVFRTLNISCSHITQVCNNTRISAGGFLWSYNLVEELSIKSAKSHPKQKKILQFDLQDNFVKEWNRVTDIYNLLGFETGNIIACCKGRNKTYKKFKWYYEEDKNNSQKTW